jgi:DNA-binding response OmpR family regulator
MSVADPVKVIVVEDDPRQRQLLEILLRTEGYAVTSAPDGEKGVALVHQVLPELVITDVMMPNVSGFELCRRLRADSLTEAIPIIFLTARKSSKDFDTGFQLGADDYLAKPYQPPDLLARIRTVLQRSRSGGGRNGTAQAAARLHPAHESGRSRTRVMLSGQLSTASVTDVLQTLGGNHLTGKLEIHATEPGVLELSDGRLIRAEVTTPRRTIHGAKAWFRLADCTEGSFELWGLDPDPDGAAEPIFTQTLQSLLMDSAFHRDELRRLRAMFPAEGLTMLRRGELPRGALPIEKQLWHTIGTPLELDALIDELDHPDLEVLKSIIKLMQAKVIGGKPTAVRG